MNVLDQVRDLHALNEYGGCEHCYDGDCDITWPCETAALVYTEQEINEAVQTWRSWHRWGTERDKRRQLAKGWSAVDDMQLTLVRSLTRSLLKERFVVSEILQQPVKYSGGSALFTISGTHTGLPL